MNDNHLSPLLAHYAQSPTPEIMSTLVEGYLPLSRAIARKFAGRGVETEDLEQVAAMALMKAIERFEPDRGLKFTTFATPTIAGEVRNYIRDKGSIMRISRDARSQLYRMQQVRDSLTQQLQREPSVRELAEAMQLTYEELLSLLDQRDMSEVQSLSAATSADEDAQQLEDRLGVIDQGFEMVEQSEWMKWVLRQLTPAEQQLLQLRFVERLGQRDCAREMGVSQMQISRMERRMLARLRESTERWQH
ncbi:MAG: sigma-70 family RNA polymerase sigma factor [Clostridia bacterium]|nr:sigma-70 family RNA polymerase sigma factor [Clostridia bacterium]